MKRKYTSPRLIPIGDMVNNTLGSSGTRADNGTLQAGANGGTNPNGTNTNGTGTTNFNTNNFNNDGFTQ